MPNYEQDKASEMQHRVLDQAIEELRKSAHIALDASHQTEYYRTYNDPQRMDLIEQVNSLIDIMVTQLRQVIFSPMLYPRLLRHIKEQEAMRATTYAEIIASYSNLDGLRPLLDLEEERQAQKATKADSKYS